MTLIATWRDGSLTLTDDENGVELKFPPTMTIKEATKIASAYLNRESES